LQIFPLFFQALNEADQKALEAATKSFIAALNAAVERYFDVRIQKNNNNFLIFSGTQ
jgi:hypothetical protein